MLGCTPQRSRAATQGPCSQQANLGGVQNQQYQLFNGLETAAGCDCASRHVIGNTDNCSMSNRISSPATPNTSWEAFAKLDRLLRVKP